MGRHTGLTLDEFFDGVARSGWSLLDGFDVKVFCRAVLWGLSFHNHFTQKVVVGELYEQRLLAAGVMKYARFGLVAHHGEAYFHRIFALQGHVELAFEVGHDEFAL